MARKWRPKNFSELIGQEAVRKTLTNALTQKRIHPALLFTGPRGTGKTSAARIFAKTLRCRNQKNLIPCEKCDDCRSIQSGRNLDVMEIDGASNNGVDSVRDLRDTAHYMPSSGSYKIYIIDEAHMLTVPAFNALLKTLEEPPAHVVFIMATTASEKIPRTVLSRCQKLEFHLIPLRSLKEQLENICQGENLSVDEGALWLVAKQAQGSLRDGQSLLDQMVNFCDGRITLDQITDVLGLTDPALIFDILQAVVLRSEARMLKNIQAFALKGGEPDILFQNLTENVRDLLMLKLNPKNSPVLVHASEEEINRLKDLGEKTSYEDLHLVFDMLLKAERDLSFCHDRRMALEVLLLRLSQAPRVEQIAPFNLSDRPSKKDARPFGSDSVSERKTEKILTDHPSEGSKAPGAERSPVKALSKESESLQSGGASKPSSQSLQSEGGASVSETGVLQSVLSGGPGKSGGASKPSSQSLQLEKDSAFNEIKARSSSRLKDHTKYSEKTQPEKTQPEKPPSSRLKDNNNSSSLNKERGKPEGALHVKPPPRISKDKWFAFIEFVRKKDPKLAGLIEALSLKQEDSEAVVFLLPEKISFFRQVTEPKTHELLEDLLTSFMKSKTHLKIQFEDSKGPVASLREQKQASESKALREKALSHPFVQTAKEVFKGEIRTVSKMK